MTQTAASSFEQDIADTLAAIEHCIDLRQHMPAKILIYALIDSLAWAASDKKPKTTHKNFETWVARWLIPELATLGVNITPNDLYAARCAILHTMTPDSDLSATGKARRVAYAWGTGSAEWLNHFFKTQAANDVVAIHYNDLYSSLRSAISAFLSEVAADPILGRYVSDANDRHYAYIGVPLDSQ